MVSYHRNVISGVRYFLTLTPADRASALRVADPSADFAAGDANGDNAYTTADSTAILNQILELGSVSGNPDCRQDSQINVQDLVCLNTLIAAGATPPVSPVGWAE